MNQTKDSAETALAEKRLVTLGRKIDDNRQFLQALEAGDKTLYKSIRDRLRIDTHDELTDTEYDNLSTMMFFCDKFEEHFYNQNPEDVDVDLFNIYRMAKEKITDHLKDYREASKKTPSSIKGIQQYLEQIKMKDGTIITRGFKQADEGEIIEIEEVKDG